MTTNAQKTYLPKQSEIVREWYEVDASIFPLGRLATRVAHILRGKHKPMFTPHMDVGDFVVVKNARNVKLTGRKLDQKEYYHFSGYPGGLKKRTLRSVLEKHPERVIENAVRLMLASNRMRKSIMRRLKVVPDDKHTFKIDKKIEK